MRFLLAALFAIPLILGAPAEGDAAGKSKNKGKGGPTPTYTQGKADKGKSNGVSTAAGAPRISGIAMTGIARPCTPGRKSLTERPGEPGLWDNF